MTLPRGREARLKAEFAGLYPGLQPGVWTPVERLLHLVTELIHHDRGRSGIITGDRLLREEHFDYRGQSVRPTGLPEGSTRLSDVGVVPNEDQEERGLNE
jgi:hypothetical protein